MKKKHTIVYAEPTRKLGVFLTKYVHVETDNLKETLKDYDVYFVFDGHCQETAD